jgi:hypothetical protein
MTSNGFIKLSRKLVNGDLWNEPRQRSKLEAWLFLLFKAAFKPTTVVIDSFEIELRRGELIASDTYLTREWGWSRNKVRLFLKNLQLEERITLVPHEFENQVGRIIHIVNYNTYQGEE